MARSEKRIPVLDPFPSPQYNPPNNCATRASAESKLVGLGGREGGGRHTGRVSMAKRLPIFLGWILILGASQGSAQKFVEFPRGAQGLYHVPASGPVSHIAFLTVHRTGDNLNHVSTEELPKRGFSVLGLSTRFRNNEAAVNWELMALDVRAGVRFLRSQPGITRVILIGHSGGGPTTSYYQAVAENGVSFCQDPHKLVQCSSEQLAGFVATDKADGIVFTDGHPSNGLNRLRELNPSLISEDSSPHEEDQCCTGSLQREERLQPRRRVSLLDGVRRRVLQGAGPTNEQPDRKGPCRSERICWRESMCPPMMTHSFSIAPARDLRP